jgi:hypothetical protein
MQPLSSLIPRAQDFLALEVEELAGVLLVLDTAVYMETAPLSG